MRVVVFGLSITSSWGNGHATTYRGLLRELAKLGHQLLFLEWDAPWYAANRDLPEPRFCRTVLYSSLDEVLERCGSEIRGADCVMVGSYVDRGIEVGKWVSEQVKGIRVFYDIDTPITLAALAAGKCPYLSEELIPRYDLYLSFTGGPTLSRIEAVYGSPAARPLYCSVDPELHYPVPQQPLWDLGYLGTYSEDRQPGVERLLCAPARAWQEGRFAVAGPQYPDGLTWPPNTTRIEHLAPQEHREFYCAQRFTLNITRKEMLFAGYSPSVRLFEAAACGVPVISDIWPGLESFFIPGKEILPAAASDMVLGYLRDLPEGERRAIGEKARQRVLSSHTAAHRAKELEGYLASLKKRPD